MRLDLWDADLHTPLLRALATNPAVVRHIGDGSPWSEARIAAVAAHGDEHWRAHGFGWRVATLTATGASVGFIALSFAGPGAGIDADEYEIGWWLAPEAWRKGLAREGAAAVRDEAFERVGAPSVVARIAPANAASLLVAAAIGLRPEGSSIGRGGEPIAVLRLDRVSWQARSA